MIEEALTLVAVMWAAGALFMMLAATLMNPRACLQVRASVALWCWPLFMFGGAFCGLYGLLMGAADDEPFSDDPHS